MLKKSEKQEFSDPGVQIYSDLETLLMQNIIRHVRNYNQLIDSDTWLMQKLAEIGKLNRENMKIIAKTAGLSRTAVERMLEEVADLVMERVEPDLYEIERKGILDQTIPAKKSKNVKAAVQAIQKQALDSLNVCNTTMLYMARDAYTRLAQQTAEKAEEIANKQEFLDSLGKHATAQIIGAESRQQAIRDTIKEFNEKGIPAFVDKRGREWTPEAYVAMTLRATAGNTATEAMFARMEDRGLSLVQVSEHPGARPKCAKDQGKIFDRNNNRGTTTDLHGKQIPFYPLKESSYGEPDGLFGINCGHHGAPFIPGVSRQRYQPTKDMEENDKLYRKMQTQRSMERKIRKQKRLCSLYDKAGEEEAFEKAAVKLKEKEAQLTQYLEKNNSLVRRKDREQVVGFDKGISARAVAKNKAYTKARETDTISIKDTYIRKAVGAKSQNYDVIDPETGEYYHFAEGTKIKNSQVFAGKGTKHSLHPGVAEGLSEQIGGTPSKWQHCKGHGIIDYYGEERPAEVHWFQEETVGKVKFKVKRWEDED